LDNSPKVRVLQWRRRCLENYLIDVDTLTDLLQDPEVVQDKLSSLGEVNKLLRDLAFSQLDELVAKKAYAQYSFEDPNLRASEIRGRSIAEISEILFSRLRRMNQQTSGVTDHWKTSFVTEAERHKRELAALWDVKWMENCDGKQLFTDLYRNLKTFRLPLRRLKKRVIQEMARKQTENWLSIQSLLAGLLS